jgi:hypothetical protein
MLAVGKQSHCEFQIREKSYIEVACSIFFENRPSFDAEACSCLDFSRWDV